VYDTSTPFGIIPISGTHYGYGMQSGMWCSTSGRFGAYANFSDSGLATFEVVRRELQRDRILLIRESPPRSRQRVPCHRARDVNLHWNRVGRWGAERPTTRAREPSTEGRRGKLIRAPSDPSATLGDGVFSWVIPMLQVERKAITKPSRPEPGSLTWINHATDAAGCPTTPVKRKQTARWQPEGVPPRP
jgi:hypothetical protein